MNTSENSSEYPISSVDSSLVGAMHRVDQKIEENLLQKLGSEDYSRYQELTFLEESLLEQPLAKETVDALRTHYDDLFTEQVAGSARQIIEDDTHAFDEDSERHSMESNPHEPEEDDEDTPLVNDARLEVTEELAEKFGAVLSDKYPNLKAEGINGGQVTFIGRAYPVDSHTEALLLIQFRVLGGDIKTEVFYSFVPLTLGQGEVRTERVDIEALGGVIDGISLDTLKRDTLKALWMTIEDESPQSS